MKRVTFFRAFAVLGMSLGCRSYPFIFQPASSVQGVTKEQTDLQPGESDILFVIDNSGSMADKQLALTTSFGKYIATFATSQNKFQIGITTTDNTCSTVPPSPNPWDGKCGRLFSPDGTDPIIRRSDFANDNDVVARFNDIVSKIGTAGSPYEQGMKSAYEAISADLTGTGKPNAGFLRPAAKLVIAIVSDESDCSYSFDAQQGLDVFVLSHLDTGQSCYQFADKLPTPNFWAQQILNIKTRQGLVAVATITSSVRDSSGAVIPSECVVGSDGQPSNKCSCFEGSPLSYCQYTAISSPPPGQVGVCDVANPNCCIGLANDRYSQFADFWTTHFKDSVCQNDYSNALEQFGKISDNNCFPIDPPPANDDATNIQIKRRLSDESTFSIVPLLPYTTPDQAKQGGGNGWWYYVDPSTQGQKVHNICLLGNYQRVLNDTYRIFVLSSTQGADSNIAAQ